MFVRESDSCCNLAVIVIIRQYDSTTWQNILKPNTKTQSAVTMQENLSTVQIITKNAKNFRKRIFYKIKPLSESETKLDFPLLFFLDVLSTRQNCSRFLQELFTNNVTSKRISYLMQSFRAQSHPNLRVYCHTRIQLFTISHISCDHI